MSAPCDSSTLGWMMVPIICLPILCVVWVCQSACLSLYLSIHLSVLVSVCLFVGRSVCRSVCLSISLCIGLKARLSAFLVRLSILCCLHSTVHCVSVSFCGYAFLYTCACLPAWLCLSV